jgi:hypothetical protein
MEDTSLDEFLNGGESDDGSDVPEESGSDTDESGDGPDNRLDPANAEPARTTHQWVPAGVPCDACGREVERRWESDEGLVCPDCKKW